MTTELQRVMAQYEDARIRYKMAVLASLNGDSSGDAIREAIREFQRANAELKRVTGVPARPPRPAVAQAANDKTEEDPPFAFRFVRRLLNAG